MQLSTDDLLRAAQASALGSVRPAFADDAVDTTMPRGVIEPPTPENLAAVLAWAARERLSVVLRGGGTKLAWGRVAAGIDLLVGTGRLNRLVAHRHGDLTATIEAGASLRDVNAALVHHGQWLPIDSPFEGATIGGIVATNDAGPLRHRFGTPRDLLIGITLALTDGRLVKAGGTVVKNVAGYDLGKLVSGSFGTLAGIVNATFKLTPLAAASKSLVVSDPSVERLANDIAAIGGSQLEPSAFDLRTAVGVAGGPAPSPSRVLIRFMSSPRATDIQVDAARQMMGGRTEVVEGAAETALWDEQIRDPWRLPGGIVRLSWLPARLPAVLALMEELSRSTGCAVDLAGRARVGAGLLRLAGSEDAQVAIVERLRAERGVVDNVVLLRADRAVKDRVDVWHRNSAGTVLAAIKRSFDPAGILNAGRGPV